ncbi:hypothetical protein F2P56_012818 [Juglans regia]|uniref:Integrase catalytic domain-containing protein n=2 Tax=Juglans regia TaxID=51240 RepID=A0A834CZ47_JUGRE|nr:uncharacterized protein LOC108986528 [Juglans regia]KAF5468681.1 hypothetical protein F2P56_012818 [Juglans regia]
MLTLVVTARRLRPYFQAYPVKVQTDVLLRKILQKCDITGQMTSWGKQWQVYVDGSSCRIGGGAGLHIVTDSGERFDYALKLRFKVTNNEEEYEPLLLGLTLARSLSATEVEVKADSQIVVGQVTGQFLTKGENLKRYLQRVGEKRDRFQYFANHQIPRGENQEAGWVTKAASGQEEVPLPDHVVAQTVDIAAVGIWVSAIEQAQYVLAEIHEGVCGNHASKRALALRIARAVYYWPNTHKDADKFARKCLKCQENAPIPHCPPAELTFVTAQWPFVQWGLDLIDPLPTGKGGVKFVIVAVDYFTKWVKAEALATITTRAITNFLWKSIICRFGIPQSFISDNGRNFDVCIIENGAWSSRSKPSIPLQDIRKPTAK